MRSTVGWQAIVAVLLGSFAPPGGLVVCYGADGHLAIKLAGDDHCEGATQERYPPGKSSVAATSLLVIRGTAGCSDVQLANVAVLPSVIQRTAGSTVRAALADGALGATRLAGDRAEGLVCPTEYAGFALASVHDGVRSTILQI